MRIRNVGMIEKLGVESRKEVRSTRHAETMVTVARPLIDCMSTKARLVFSKLQISVSHVGWWLVNVAVSEVSIMRMRACGQLANNINPIQALFSFHGY